MNAMEFFSATIFQNGMIIPLLMGIGLILLICNHWLKPKEKMVKPQPLLKRSYFIKRATPTPKWDQWDRYFVVLFTLCYGYISILQLGHTKIPTTYWQPEYANVEIIFHTDSSYDAIMLIGGEGDNNNNPTTYQIGMDGIEFYGSYDNTNYTLITTIEDSAYMQYKKYTVDQSYPYIKMVVPNINSVVNEIALVNTIEEVVVPLNIVSDPQSNYPATLLIDEQDEFIIDPSWQDETYFDEVYHVRNAVEIVNGQYMYASVHPLLGTNIMAFFIALLGNHPFGWRFGGWLFGVLLVPLFYAIAKSLLRDQRYSAIACGLFCLDFMHLTTSRIGTLEPFSLFFILLMFYFMIQYTKTSMVDTPLKKQWQYLLCCGLSMGLAWSTKWTGCYSSLGLAILFFIHFFGLTKEYLIAKKKKDQLIYEDTIEQQWVDIVLSTYIKKMVLTILFCIVVFVVLPVIIYFGIHLVDHIWRDGYSISNMIDQIIYMYEYHIDLTATHPFQSQWYQWILDIRPIWYYIKRTGDLANSISCFSNPIITWNGFVALFYCGYLWLKHKNDGLTITWIGLLTALGPWMLVTRCVFAYHFYPSTPFYILLVVYMLRDIEMKTHSTKITKWIVIASLIVFILFLPATCGFLTTQDYLNGFLSWLPSWNLN